MVNNFLSYEITSYCKTIIRLESQLLVVDYLPDSAKQFGSKIGVYINAHTFFIYLCFAMIVNKLERQSLQELGKIYEIWYLYIESCMLKNFRQELWQISQYYFQNMQRKKLQIFYIQNCSSKRRN